MIPRPWQIQGAEFLASRKSGLLAWDCRTGKTGASLLAANKINASHVCVITTRSGIPVWQRAFDQWKLQAPQRTLISWGQPDHISEMSRCANPYVLIIDECHKAANPTSLRTIATYGQIEADGLFHRENSAVYKADRIWCLSATPAPHDNGNWWPMIRSLAPELLTGVGPQVRGWHQFRDRYCKIGYKKLPNGSKIEVVIGGQNSEELGIRLAPFFMRKTQSDVGISEPTFDLLPLNANLEWLSAMERRFNLNEQLVIRAAEAGDTDSLHLALSSLMMATGSAKAEMVAQSTREELENGLDKIVLAYWHRNVGDRLEEALAQFNPMRLDGSATPSERAMVQRAWQTSNESRVFLAQMEAAGEAIDLSAASSMIIVEPVFRPTTMRQIAMRVVNMESRRTPLVRVAVLRGSIDERVQERLLSLWAPIKKVLD